MTTTAEWRKWNAMQTKPITNADRIRAMTDEELAEVLWLTAKGGIIGQRSKERWLDWLKEEGKVNTDV